MTYRQAFIAERVPRKPIPADGGQVPSCLYRVTGTGLKSVDSLRGAQQGVNSAEWMAAPGLHSPPSVPCPL